MTYAVSPVKRLFMATWNFLLTIAMPEQLVHEQTVRQIPGWKTVILTLNCWYFGYADKATEDYLVVCSRTSGVSDYFAQWRFAPATRLFELIEMDYGTDKNPKKIAECHSFYDVLVYVMNNRHVGDTAPYVTTRGGTSGGTS